MTDTANLIARIRSHNSGRATSGVTKMTLIADAIEHFEKSYNWTPVAMLVSGCADSERSRIKKIIAKVSGLDVRPDKKHATGYRVHGRVERQTLGTGNQAYDGVAVVRLYAEARVPFGSKVLTSGFERDGATVPALLESTRTEKTLEQMAAAYLKAAVKAGHTEAAALAAVTAALTPVEEAA